MELHVYLRRVPVRWQTDEEFAVENISYALGTKYRHVRR